MSKKPTKKKFKYSSTGSAPKSPSIKTSWDLKKHFYQSEKDPQIEKDIAKVERVFGAFIKRYKNKNFTKNASTLKEALDYREKHLAKLVEGDRVMRYFAFRRTLNAKDTVAQKRLNQLSERFRKLSNESLFFTLAIGNIPKKQRRELLKDPSLAYYRYYLERAFLEADHQLTEPEEKILKLQSRTSCGMWVDAVEKVRDNLLITYKGKEYSFTEALNKIDELAWKEKGVLWSLIMKEMERIGEFAEHELTAIVTHDKIVDELRGYKKPYSETALGYENEESSIEALVEAVSSKGFDLSKKFYKLKAKLHGVDKIPYTNKYEPLGQQLTADFDQAVTICRDVFYDLKTEYGQVFDQMLQSGQIDVYPKKGKGGGAFMASTTGLPTFVMLNHADQIVHLDTLSHEMGHAIHAEMSKKQGPLYDGFSTTTAETASTLFEQLVQQRIIEHLTPEQQIAYLDRKLSGDIATIQRQIACFNFELDMHNTIRAEGAMTNPELAAMMEKHMRSYLGPAVEITKEDGYIYVYWSHIRAGFYVYTYAYGQLVSSLMAQNYAKDNGYIEQIDTFLHSGSTDTVENIFKNIGINVRKTDTFNAGLDLQAADIERLKKLTK